MFRDETEKRQMEKAVRQSEKTYWNLFNNAQVGLFRTTLEGKVLEANERFAQMLGYMSREEILGIDSIVRHYADPAVRKQVMARLQAEGSVENVEAEMVRTDGSRIWILYSGCYYPDKGWIEGVSEDITERKAALEALRHSERRYRYLYDHSPVGLVTLDRRGQVKEINQNTLRLIKQITGIEDVGHDLRRLSRILRMALAQDLQTVFHSRESLTREQHFSARRGRDTWIKYWIDPMIDACGHVFEVLVACQDITGIKEAENRIRHLTFHDKLTDLYNRSYFEEELERLDKPRQLPLSIICGDVNGLKLVNDAFGHAEADKLLVEIANILRSCCRKEDIIARWGEDEFAILLPKTTHETAEAVCERIRQAWRQSHRQLVKPNIALGSATKETPEEPISRVVRRAEERMYRNKLGESSSVRSTIITSLMETLREKSWETEEHAERLRALALRLGRALGLPSSALDELSVMAALHDIGKVAIPDEILNKPGKLTEEEWRLLQEHPTIGYRIAQASPDLAPISEAILAHHERWDGKGYPRGLKGEEIPIISRIIAVVDAYDVMTNGRPYKEPVSRMEAIMELQRCAGTQFDPDIVKVFVAIMMQEEAIRQSASAAEAPPE